MQAATLPAGARIAVLGAGPAGSFFSLEILREARRRGRALEVLLIEGKPEPRLDHPSPALREGCNFCAGGISPRMNEVLDRLGLHVPDELIQNRVRSITVQGHWKNVELRVPPDRSMVCVYRGTRPAGRTDRERSFDAFLLGQALAEGARIVTGRALRVARSPAGGPVVTLRTGGEDATLEADFLAVATGVNHGSCGEPPGSPLARSLRDVLPGFVPPAVRPAIIVELPSSATALPFAEGALYFASYGTAGLDLDLVSVIPKREFVTVVLVGRSVDRARTHAERERLLDRFFSLPEVRKLLRGAPPPGCLCRPNLVVGGARNGVADGIAVLGDLATSRLYKDGIYSAWVTGSALARALLDRGTDARSLREAYWPAVEAIAADNRYGRMVFRMHRHAFGTPLLARIVYQAVFTERRHRVHAERRLARTLWNLASGDAPYREIFFAMVHPSTFLAVLTGGLLVTIRNLAAEAAFGLSWKGLGRHTTGVYKESFVRKREEFVGVAARNGIVLPPRPRFERMYTIRIRAPREAVFRQLGRFGDADRSYFLPRGVRVRRIEGGPNEPGSVVEYRLPVRALSFRLALEHRVPGELLLYRVLDGFARGGVLLFEIEPAGPHLCALSIYVGFDFHRGDGVAGRALSAAFAALFPAFLHDVVWNHSLCRLKDVVESEPPEEAPPAPAPATTP